MKSPFQVLHRLFNRTIKSAVAWSALSTLLRVGGGVLLLPVILHKLPEEELGLWYLFIAIGNLIYLLDMGFMTVTTRTVSYLWAGARDLQAFGVRQVELEHHGKPNFEGLHALLATLRYYYGWLGFTAFLLLGTVGTWYVWHQASHLPNWPHLLAAWLLYVLGLALGVAQTFWIVTLPGIGGIQYGARIGTLRQVINLGLTATLMLLGAGLYGLVVGTACSIVFYHWMTQRQVREIAQVPARLGRLVDKGMLRTMWPQCWRQGAGDIGFFMISHGNTIVCASVLGLAEAASYGLTLQVAWLVVGLSGVFLDVKIPQIQALRAQGKLAELVPLFVGRMRISLGFFILGATGVILCAPYFLRLIQSNTTLLPTLPLSLMLLSFMLTLHYSRVSHLTLAENRNPFVLPNLISGVAVLTTSYLLASHGWGALGLVLGNLVVILAFNNWWFVKQGLASSALSFPEYIAAYFRVPLGKI